MNHKNQKSNIAKNSRKILKFLSSQREKISPLLILTHDHPDPDALACAFALHTIASQVYGIQSKIVYDGIIGRTENKEMVRILKMPVQKLRPGHLRHYKSVALVDTQPAFGNNPFPKNRKATIVLDQHASVEKPYADLSIVDTQVGATSVILARALLLSRAEVSPAVATALVYGILSDTMNLYRSHDPDVIETYLDILPFSDLKALSEIQNPSRSRGFFTTLGRGIQNAMVRSQLIVTHLGNVENPDLVSQIADYLISYKRMTRCLCTGRHKNNLHVSLRFSKQPKISAGEIIRDIFKDSGKAGGHGTIAGGCFKVGAEKSEEEWKAAEQGLVDRLLKRLRLPMKKEFYYPFR